MSNKELQQLEKALTAYQAQVATIQGATKLAKQLADIQDTEVRGDQKKQQIMAGVVERNKARVGQTNEFDALTDASSKINKSLQSVLTSTARYLNEIGVFSPHYAHVNQFAIEFFNKAGYETPQELLEYQEQCKNAAIQGPLYDLIQNIKDTVLPKANPGSPKVQAIETLMADLKGIEKEDDYQQQAVNMIEETVKAMPQKSFIEKESEVVTALKQVRNTFATEYNLKFDKKIKPEGAMRHRNIDKAKQVGEASFKKAQQKTMDAMSVERVDEAYKKAMQVLVDKVFDLSTDERYTEAQRSVIETFHKALDLALAENTTEKMHAAVQSAFTKHEASLNKIEPDLAYKIKSWWNGLAEKSGLSDKWKFDIRAANIKQDIGFTQEQTNIEKLSADDIKDTFSPK